MDIIAFRKGLHRLLAREISSEALILFVSIFLVVVGNANFFQKTLLAYPWSIQNAGPFLSLIVSLVASFYVFFALICSRPWLKTLLVGSILMASIIGFVTNTFGVVMDETMILNSFKTDPGEVRDLVSAKFLLYIIFLGIIPSYFVLRVNVSKMERTRAMFYRTRSVAVAVLIAVITVATFGKFYASFFREHKELRSYINPLYFFYSAGKFTGRYMGEGTRKLAAFGRDSRIPPSDQERDLVIFVVGETARADHFSLNGYVKETNPLLKNEEVISLPNMWSCGTSTAISVPCMFSAFGRSGYSDKKGQSTENLLDVLQNTKRVNVLWRDNNSDSKGVALRVSYEDFKVPTKNPMCDDECRDEGMLSGLQEYIDSKTSGDILIVLHQMGNHGPAYYKRYPQRFEKFTPACHTNELANCTAVEISNAYDNAILYTDYFLSQVIGFLKQNSSQFETAMLYVSDHGESLGENGVYLHGLPYLIAPEAQKRPAAVVWLGDSMREDIDVAKLKVRALSQLSHDNIYHSLLSFFDVETNTYRKELDMFRTSARAHADSPNSSPTNN